MTEARDVLKQLSSDVKHTFDEDRTILGYGEWLELLLEKPAANLRGAMQYVRDVFDHYGATERALPRGKVTRYNLFDAPWADGDGRVAGQEPVQQEIYRLVTNFVRDGKVSRLILLHGPNGSAKSSIIHCVQSAMEHYSHTSEGALYSYAWIFPSEKIEKTTLGFGASRDDRADVSSSYAHLGSDQIDARLPCELRDHPIFFLPKPQRAKLIAKLREEGRLPEDFVISKYILQGDLSPRDRAIYDALLMANDGDHAKVLKHVQVERFYVSVSYGKGVATVEPQMHVDADARQLTADRSIANLPRALQSVPLFEIGGPLVNANRGMLEFADLLKRPVEAFKYLLSTSEEATASLPHFKILLDELLVASSNEDQLAAFKQHPDWNSFKGRIELVRVPYLRRYSDEIQIYERQINDATIAKPLAPHVVEVAAMWAVLTRLKWPNPEHYDDKIQETMKRLSPIEKLRLYDDATVPSWCSANEARELLRAVSTIEDEYKNVARYEGQLGASAREIRTLILNAAHRPEYRCLSPLPVFDELRELVSDPSLYDFLKQEPRHGFHENAHFIHAVHDWWLDLLDDEVRTSMGLVEEAKYEELFTKYIVHVSHFVKKEKLLDKITGKYVDPDTELMSEVESLILAEGESRDDFRHSIINRIGAWSLDHQGDKPNYRELFAGYIDKMESDYFAKQRKVIAKNLRALLDLLVDENDKNVRDETRKAAERTIEVMESRFGYAKPCTAECAAYLLKARYADDD
ncbi:MAG: serine protein kinase PrkA [Deltaproteobacteria bacterium]